MTAPTQQTASYRPDSAMRRATSGISNVPGVQADPGQAARAFAGHVVEMRRAAANHCAQRNDAVDAPCRRHLVDSERHLERTRDTDDLDVAIDGAVLAQAMQGALDQGLDNEIIEARCDDRKACVADDEVPFSGLYPVHACA